MLSGIFKAILSLLGIVTLIAVLYFIAIYPLIREAPPIREYEMINISPIELEKRINKIIEGENYVFNPNDTLFDMNDNIEKYRYVTLGRDSVKYFFETQLDEVKNLEKLNLSYIKLGSIFLKHADSIGNRHYQFNTYDDFLKLDEVFEEEFLSKLGEWKEKKWYHFWW